MNTTKYYHYTPEVKLEEIIESGKIKLATAFKMNKKEKSCAWVSTNENWENTATKMIQYQDGSIKQLIFEEQLKRCGCARIEVESTGLYPWGKLKHVAKIDRQSSLEMEATGISCGARPKEWFGSLYPITNDRWIKAEVFKNGEWTVYKEFKNVTSDH